MRFNRNGFSWVRYFLHVYKVAVCLNCLSKGESLSAVVQDWRLQPQQPAQIRIHAQWSERPYTDDTIQFSGENEAEEKMVGYQQESWAFALLPDAGSSCRISIPIGTFIQ